MEKWREYQSFYYTTSSHKYIGQEKKINVSLMFSLPKEPKDQGMISSDEKH